MKHKFLCAVSVFPALLVMPAMAYSIKSGDDLNTLYESGTINENLVLELDEEFSYSKPTISITGETSALAGTMGTLTVTATQGDMYLKGNFVINAKGGSLKTIVENGNLTLAPGKAGIYANATTAVVNAAKNITNEGALYGVFTTGKSNVSVTAGETLSVSGAQYGLASMGGSEMDLKGKTVDISAEQNSAIMAQGNSTIKVNGDVVNITGADATNAAIGGQYGSDVNITGTNSITVSNISDQDNAMAIHVVDNGSHINLTGKNITVSTGAKTGRAIVAANGTTNVTDKSKVASVNLTSENADGKISISAPNGRGLQAVSQAIITVKGNTEITAPDAIYVHGDSKVDVNSAGLYTTKMDGDIRFEYYTSHGGNSSGTPIDSTVDVTLAGADSYWNGNAVVSYYTESGMPADDYLTVTGLTLNLKDGATWNASAIADSETKGQKTYGENTYDYIDGQKYVAINNLNIDTGTVNIADAKNGITIDKSADIKNGTFSGGPLNIASTAIAKVADSTFDSIVNDGELAFSGDVTLDSGITGTGAVEFAASSTLNAKLNKTLIVADSVTTNGANLNLIVANGTADDTYDFVSATSLDKAFSIGTNALYDITMTDAGAITIAKKGADEVANSLSTAGVKGNAVGAIVAISGVSTTGNAQADAVFAAVSDAVQTGDMATVQQIIEVVNPEDKPVVQAVAASAQGEVLNLVSNRLSGFDMGRNGGDVMLTGGGVWAQGLFNKSKLNGSFHGYTRGAAFGVDEVIEHDITLGLGYAYGHTDVNTNNGRQTEVTSNTLFLYAQYKPNDWFINGVAQYTLSDYEEGANVIGVAKSGKYGVDSFGGSVMTGYKFASGATPELGVRYLNVAQDDYVDSFGIKVSSDTTQYLTTVAGVKYVFDVDVTYNWTLKPELRAAATYDVLSDKSVSKVTVPGAASYVVNGERLSRVGGEFGVGLATVYRGLELSVNYDLDLHKDYTSQTGMVRARCEF